MALVFIGDRKVAKEDFEKAREDYGTYVKITVDLESSAVVLGGEYHADAEKVLLDQGSKQHNIWGGGINLETKKFETNAMINLRAGRNDSTEILDSEVRKMFLLLAKKVLKKHV
jgi:hypothetical protein